MDYTKYFASSRNTPPATPEQVERGLKKIIARNKKFKKAYSSKDKRG